MSLDKLYLAGKNLIISGQGELVTSCLGTGNSRTFFTVYDHRYPDSKTHIVAQNNHQYQKPKRTFHSSSICFAIIWLRNYSQPNYKIPLFLGWQCHIKSCQQPAQSHLRVRMLKNARCWNYLPSLQYNISPKIKICIHPSEDPYNCP